MSKNIELIVHYTEHNTVCGYTVLEVRTFLWWTIVSKHTVNIGLKRGCRIEGVTGFKKEW